MKTNGFMKKALSVMLGAMMATSAIPAAALQYEKDDDTVVYVDFDSELPEGSTKTAVYYYDEGIYGNCALFGGTKSHIKLPDNITAGVTDFTMATWVKLNETTGRQRFIDLGSGTTNFAFLGINSEGKVRGDLCNGGVEVKLTGDEVNKYEWTHVAMTKKGDTLTLYVNGVEAQSAETSFSLAGMGNTTSNYIGRSQFPGDPYFNGYLDEIVVCSRAYDATEIATLASREIVNVTEELLKSYVDIPNADNVKGSLNLPAEVNGATVTWTSSNEDVVCTAEIPNGDYTIPAGRVTRGTSDENVTLTATVSYAGVTAVKSFDITVKAIPEDLGEMTGYLYVYFRGNVNGSDEHLQIHLAASEDGYTWFDLNGNWPILTSTMGTGGLRDPYLLRSKDGDKFYLIATDLDTLDAQGWGPWSKYASKYLAVWESDDLVNWSEERLVKFANDYMGCAWAPETIYDEDTDEYLVYAAAKDLTMASPIDTVYVVRTRDFVTFSEPEYFTAPANADGSRIAAIDSNIIKADDGKYYQFYKKYNSEIHMLVSDHASGPYEEVTSFRAIGGEGPASYKINGTDDYCLAVDNYSVYVPYITTDIASGSFTQATSAVKMPTGSKHGGFLPVNAEEWNRVMSVYGSPEPDEKGADARYTFDFESDSDMQLFGNATVAYSEEKGSNVLKLDGTDGTFAQFPENIFDRRDSFTLSFDVKNNDTVEKANMAFAVGQNSDLYYFFRMNPTSFRTAITISSYPYEESAETGNIGSQSNEWMHIDLVVEPNRIATYKNGLLVSENKSVTKSMSHVGLSDLKAYLGKSMYAADTYFSGEFDNVKLYYRAFDGTDLVSDDETAVAGDAAVLNLGYDEDAVRGNVTLATEGFYGSTISWETSNADIIALDGTVVRNENGAGDSKVTLTATVTRGDAQTTRVFNVIVKEKAEEWLSTADFSTHSFTPAKGKFVIMYDFTPTCLTNATMGFASSTNTPSAWGHYNMVVRSLDGGYLEAYNNTTFAATNVVNYVAGKTYKIIIDADVTNKKYSVYVASDGVVSTLAENYTFRSSAPTASDIAKMTVRGGDGVAAGLYTVSDLKVMATDAYIKEAFYEDGTVSGKIFSMSEKSGQVVVILYDENGTFTGIKKDDFTAQVGTTEFNVEGVSSDTVKIMFWDGISKMTPYVECKTR